MTNNSEMLPDVQKFFQDRWERLASKAKDPLVKWIAQNVKTEHRMYAEDVLRDLRPGTTVAQFREIGRNHMLDGPEFDTYVRDAVAAGVLAE